jgi:hypothetical protein
MVEEREGRRVLFGIHKDDFSVIYRGILYSGAKDQSNGRRTRGEEGPVWYIEMIFQFYVEEYCTAELRIKWWKNERGGGSCSVHKDDFSIISRRKLYSEAKDQMVEE